MENVANKQFLADLKKVSEVMVYAERTNAFLPTSKRWAKKEAETNQISYYITDTVFVSKRNVIVIY